MSIWARRSSSDEPSGAGSCNRRILQDEAESAEFPATGSMTDAGFKRRLVGNQRCRVTTLCLLWIANASLLLAVAVWIVADPKFTQVAAAQRALLDRSAPTLTPPIRNWSPLGNRLLALRAAAVGAAASLIVLGGSLFFGTRRSRGMRSWLALVTLTCGWLTVVTTWPEISWAGLWWRARGSLGSFEAVAASLRDDWPTEDGQRKELGPYMAYRSGDARTLIMLTRPPVPHGSVSFSAIERSTSGGLRFHLAGDHQAAWLEWHPTGEQPDSFVGGLQDGHTLVRFTRLVHNWFLVCYERS